MLSKPMPIPDTLLHYLLAGLGLSVGVCAKEFFVWLGKKEFFLFRKKVLK